MLIDRDISYLGITKMRIRRVFGVIMFAIRFVLQYCVQTIVELLHVFTGDCKTIDKALIDCEFFGFNL